MGYSKCIELAGAEVLLFETFGSYQGDWWAKVEYRGQTGWVTGSYGSCSGCDAFQAEFSFNCHDHWDLKDDCEQCQEIKERMADFGRQYLDNIMSQEEAEEVASRNLDWDYDAQAMVGFLKANPC